MEEQLPLAGIVIVELSDNASAPFAGKTLAELGAEVWKVERPSGDSARGWGPSSAHGSSGAFHAINRGKRCISVDIKSPAELARLRQLILERADVFLHNLRPATSGAYGLDPETLRAHKPELICAEIGAFGHVGPMKDLPGYDPLMQAFAGIMSITGENGRSPVRAGVSIVDFGSAMWSVIGIVSALLARRTTGRGSTINGSLLETAIAWMSIGIANYNIDGETGDRHGSGVAFIVPHRAYPTCDGDLIVSAANDALFARLAAALGHPEWALDERFTTNAGRLAHRDLIDANIGAVLRTGSREHWQSVLRDAGLPVAPIQTVAEIVAHAQTEALGIIQSPNSDDFATVGLPLSFDGFRPPPLHPVRCVGADNAALDKFLDTGAQ